MEKFESVLLTAAKRPALFEDQGEVECLVQDKVALYDRDNKTKNEDGLLRLTTHRLIWQGAKGEALGVSLALVTTTELQVDLPVLSFLTRQPSDFSSSFFFFFQAGFMASSPKISVNFAPGTFVKLSFRNGGHQAFLTKLQSTIAAATWKACAFSLSSTKLLV